jgi:hypothetical protein
LSFSGDLKGAPARRQLFCGTAVRAGPPAQPCADCRGTALLYHIWAYLGQRDRHPAQVLVRQQRMVLPHRLYRRSRSSSRTTLILASRLRCHPLGGRCRRDAGATMIPTAKLRRGFPHVARDQSHPLWVTGAVDDPPAPTLWPRTGKRPLLANVGPQPTPRPTRLIRELLAREGRGVTVTRGSTYENRANLAPGFFADSGIRPWKELARPGRDFFEVFANAPI